LTCVSFQKFEFQAVRAKLKINKNTMEKYPVPVDINWNTFKEGCN
jgi:hypothetical protein